MRLKLYRGVWCIVWIEAGKTRRHSLRTGDRATAEQRMADTRKRPVGDSIREIFAAYSADRKAVVARHDRIETAWKALEPHFAHLRPDQVDRDACRAYTKRRSQAGRQPATINKELGVLRAALQWRDPKTPAVFELPSPPPPRDRYLTREEYGRLLEACRSPHMRLFVILALNTAGRMTAILQLTWDRVDFGRGLIRLAADVGRRKGRATVPMTDAARAALETAREAARTAWVIEYGDAPVVTVKKAFGRAAARAKLAGVTPHVMRHTAAVWMAEAGASMPEIAAYLGHSDSRVTERTYARFSPDFLRRAAKALA